MKTLFEPPQSHHPPALNSASRLRLKREKIKKKKRLNGRYYTLIQLTKSNHEHRIERRTGRWNALSVARLAHKAGAAGAAYITARIRRGRFVQISAQTDVDIGWELLTEGKQRHHRPPPVAVETSLNDLTRDNLHPPAADPLMDMIKLTAAD